MARETDPLASLLPALEQPRSLYDDIFRQGSASVVAQTPAGAAPMPRALPRDQNADLESLLFPKQAPVARMPVEPAATAATVEEAPPFGTWQELQESPQWQDGSVERRQALEREWIKAARSWGQQRFAGSKKDLEAYNAALSQARVSKVPTATVSDRISDAVIGVMAGAEGLVGSIGSLLGIQGDTADRGFVADLLNPQNREDAAQRRREGFSEARKNAEKFVQERIAETPEGSFERFTTTLKAAGVERPSVGIGMAVEQVPNLLATLVPGAAAGRAATLLGAGRAAAAQAAQTTAAVSGAALGAGQARGEVAQTLRSATEEQWRTDPEYNALRADIGDEAAKQQIIDERSRLAAAIGGTLGFAAGRFGIEQLLGGTAGRSLRARLGRGAAEIATEIPEEVAPVLEATRQLRALAPETPFSRNIPETVAQTILATGPVAGAAAALPVRGEQQAAPAPAPTPETPPAAPEEGPPAPATETFRDRAAARVATLEGTLADIEARTDLSDSDKAEQRVAVQEALDGWNQAIEEFDNTPAVRRLRQDIEDATARIEQITGGTLDDATKATLLAPLQARVQRAEELLALADRTELELEQYVQDREQAMLDLEQQRGTGAVATNEQMRRLVDERNLANKILDERALVETPTERAFAARERTVFEKDKSGNYIYPPIDELNSYTIPEAFDALSDIVQSRIYDARTNRIYTRSERTALISEARDIAESVERARALFAADDQTIAKMGADLRQGLVNLMRRGQMVGPGRLNELAAVIARESAVQGEQPITWGEARSRAARELQDLIMENTPPPDQPTGPGNNPPPVGPPTEPPKPPKGATGANTDGYTFNTGAAYPGARNFKNKSEIERAVALLNEMSSINGGTGWPKAVVQALGIRFMLNTSPEYAGFYIRDGAGAYTGQIAIGIFKTNKVDDIHTAAHEVAHALDNIERTGGRFITNEFPDLKQGGEMRREIEAYDKLFVAGNAPQQSAYPLNFWYPLRSKSEERIVPTELFAQILAYYHTSPQDLAKYTPKAYAFAERVFNGLRQLESAGQLNTAGFADALRTAFSGVGNAPGAQPIVSGSRVAGTEGAAGARPVVGDAGGGVAAEVRPVEGSAEGVLAQEEILNERAEARPEMIEAAARGAVSREARRGDNEPLNEYRARLSGAQNNARATWQRLEGESNAVQAQWNALAYGDTEPDAARMDALQQQIDRLRTEQEYAQRVISALGEVIADLPSQEVSDAADAIVASGAREQDIRGAIAQIQRNIAAAQAAGADQDAGAGPVEGAEPRDVPAREAVGRRGGEPGPAADGARREGAGRRVISNRYTASINDAIDSASDRVATLREERAKLQSLLDQYGEDPDIANLVGAEIANADKSIAVAERYRDDMLRKLQAVGQRERLYGKATTAVRLQRALANIFGLQPSDVAKRLPRVNIISESQLDANDRIEIRPGMFAQAGPLSAAFYSPTTNEIYLIPERIPQGREIGIIMHELFHKRGGQLLGTKFMRDLRDQVAKWRNFPAGSVEREIWNTVMPHVVKMGRQAGDQAAAKGLGIPARIAASRETFNEELLPYFIQEALDRGIRPNFQKINSNTAEGMLARFWRAAANALSRVFGRKVQESSLTVEDLMAAAWGASQLELGAQDYERMARGEKVVGPFPGERGALMALASTPALRGRIEEIRNRQRRFIPEEQSATARAIGVAPSTMRAPSKSAAVNPSIVNPIYASNVQAAAANAAAPAPGPGRNAAYSIYQRFAPTKADPMKSNEAVQSFADTEEVPTAPWFPQARDEFIENWIDAQRPVWNWLRDNALSMKPWQQLKLIPGRLRALTDRYTREIVDPISKSVNDFAAKYKIDAARATQIVGQWTTMRHIPEANAQLRKKILARVARGDTTAVNDLKRFDETQRGMHPPGDPQRGAMAGGWTDAEARAIQQKFESRYDVKDLERIGDQIVADFRKMRDEAVKFGQISQAALKEFPNFKHYVALTGTPWDDSQNDAFGSYVSPNILKERGGRTEGVADHALVALVDRIGRVAAYGSSRDFKASINEIYDSNGAEKNTLGITKLQSEAGQSPWASDIIWQDPQGKRWIFRFDGPAESVGPALLNKNREYADSAIARMMDRATRTFSRAVTQWTIAFAPINMLRDVQEKSVLIRSRNVTDADGKPVDPNELFKRTWANAIKPETWRAAWAIAKMGEADNSTTAGRLANELVRNGGISTFGQTLRRGQDAIEAAVKKQRGFRKGVKNLDDAVTSYNTLFEVISSLSTHAAMRELGVESNNAAFQTLDLMNFSNQGAKTAWLRHLYSFFNPAVQSGTNLWKQVSTVQGRKDALAMAFVMAGLYALAYGLSPEDEEGVGRKLDERGSFEIERNVPLYLLNEENPVKIPVGFGLPQMVWAMIVNAARFSSGRYDAKDALMQQATAFVKTFSPIPPAEVEWTKQPNVFFAKTVFPTVFRPVIDLATDTNAFGGKLTPYYPDKTKFRAEQGSPATPVMYKEVADQMRALGVDAYPEQWRTFIEGTPLGWGPFGYLLKSMAQSSAEIEGRQRDLIDQLPFSTVLRVTGASRLIGGTSRYLEARYHQQYDKALVDLREFNRQKAAGNDAEWLSANPERADRIDALKANEKSMRQITKDYNAMLRGMQNGSLDFEESRQALEDLSNARRDQMRAFLVAAKQWDEEELGDPVDVEER